MSGGARVSYEELLAAGAVLPRGTEDAGERAVPLTARSYTHPGLDDRVVVRLVAGELGVAEDQAAGYLGLAPAAEPVEVGLGARQALGFPEWVLVHHPEDGQHALAVVPELERIARQAKTRPKTTLDAYRETARQLAAAVPHFLPTFYEQAGRVFLSVDNPTYAAQMFGRARDAEAEHGLTVDEERLDAVFLEFALAGALTASALSGYAKELAARLPAAEALERFTRLCVRRTAGGLVPSAQLATDVRRLVRAAGADGGEAEQAYLADLLALPATAQAAPGWWKSHRTAVIAVARREPEVRGKLLNVMPDSGDRAVLLLWLDILEESGALAGLWDDTLPDEERPQDGTVGWFARFLVFQARSQDYYEPTRLPALYRITELSAARLRAELAESGGELQAGHDLDLLDLLLTLDVPAGVHHQVEPRRWAKGDDRRDLLAFAADERFRHVFHQAADTFGDDEDDLDTIRVLAQSPGGRPMLADWVREVARRSTSTGLPDLPEALKRLKWLPGEALRLAEDAMREVAATDLAPLLARTLRAGLIDELGWPAWEEAARDLVPRQNVEDLYVADAWPYLITAGAAQVRVIGPGGTVLTHDLRLPDQGTFGHPGFHFVDGELLVHWRTHDHGLRGYWHHSPDRVLSLQGTRAVRGTRMNWYSEGVGVPTLPLPGGGRATGAGVLHRGDTTVPAEAGLLGDGTSYWAWGGEWLAHDPVTGQLGRQSVPAFLADVSGEGRRAPGSLAPYPFDEATPAGVPVDGLLGWRAVCLPDGSWRGEDLAGRRVTVSEERDMPYAALRFPGADRLTAVVGDGWRVELVDPDGIVNASARVDGPPGDFAAGTPILPPLRYWHCLRPRDPRGSEALRRISDETARALLKAPEPEAAVRELLPEVTDRALRAGITGVLRNAVEQQKVLDAAATRLTEELSGVHEEEGPAGPSDRLLREALSGLDGSRGNWYHYTADRDNVFRRLRVLRRALRADEAPMTSVHAADDLAPALRAAGDPAQAVRLLVVGRELPGGYLDEQPLADFFTATALRVASSTTPPAHREPLVALLREFDALGLSSATGPWRWVSLQVEARHLRTPDGEWREGSWSGVLPLDGGAFLAVIKCTSRDEKGGCDFEALFHDPSGRFEAPAPYTVESTHTVGEDREAGWLTAFLAELDARGPAPWIPAAAEEFARLTGVTPTMARLIVAGLPQVDSDERSFLTPEARAVLRVKATYAALAKDELRKTDSSVLRAVAAALLPRDPARLWTDGPDTAAAAEVWNSKVGKRRILPEALLGEAQRVLRAEHWTLAALLDPASEPRLSRDLEWAVTRDRARPIDEDAAGFTAATLIDTVVVAAWLAHRLPAGDPIRAALPAVLPAIRDRLAHPGLLLDLVQYVNLPDFRKAAGRPTEVATGYERYGAIIMATHDDQPAPALQVALLDADGQDPYLPALRLPQDGAPFPAEVALRLARAPYFAALLADPGDPVAGERGKDGTWYPQDPTRSVPELVTEVAKEYGIGEDAAALYLMLLAMPDPTDRNTARWTGWKPARLKATRAELAATDLVVDASRSRSGRSLFLPGAWKALPSPRLPLEQWKLPLYGELAEVRAGQLVPTEPAADLYRRAWQRIREGDVPRFEELKVKGGRRR
ncbi:DNA-binding protein [Streptomyces caniscabiei]|uniref:DNA-binding protein n=2 Tax=Streptomyces caniscabiei TaxID=2746961 RepID=UPI0029A3ABF9|nr:DNA-binding protein [Streptomyces caniscabiei]MDX2606265.1 DNA-binding protein [Streptomyces caniscabiei]MDX2741435.1 DNA-binding protein [Streptomyces caniscabiei]